MAAVRRSSDSGMMVALGVFLVLAVVGIGAGIWFYMQWRVATDALAVDQAAFAETVGAQFRAGGWALPAPGRESYTAAAQKLASAAEYEKLMKETLGWEGAEGVRAALAESPAQQESAAAGTGTYTTLRQLLKYYEDNHGALAQRNAELVSSNASLSKRLDEAQTNFANTVAQIRQEANDASKRFSDDLAQLRTATTDLRSRLDAADRDVVASRQKYQQEVDGRRQDVTQLKAEAALWHKMYDDVVAGPGEREQLVAAGAVIEVKSDYDFVMVEGGKDREFKENDVFVVYRMTPEGKSEKKGVILVGRVNDHTSLATIAEEEGYIVAGDLFVTLERWQQFHRQPAAGAGG